MSSGSRAGLVILVLLLAACGTAPKKSVYYQDDGPPDRVPVDLNSIPDSIPRIEPMHPRANRPYSALGRNFTPITTDTPFRQRGLASWYGKQFHGNRTASGEIYDMMAMTAAHPTLPLPSYVRVTELKSGRSIIVRVNDRGPFKDERIIDLSYAAATRLGIAAAGTGEVQVDRITTAQIASGEWRRASDVAQAPVAPSARVPGSELPPYGRWTVQLGAFAQEAAADQFAQRASSVLPFVEASFWPAADRTPRVEREQGLYRVLVVVLGERAAVAALARDLQRVLDGSTPVTARQE